jgi:hypothetical protein
MRYEGNAQRLMDGEPRMTLWTVLSSGSFGIVVGWLLKEILEFWKSKAAHRSELQKRFFDERLAMTLKAMKLMKMSATSLRTTFTLLHADVASGGTAIDAGMISKTFQSNSDQTARMAEEASGAYALLRFFHGRKIAAKADAAALESILPVMQKSTSVYGKMGRYQEEVQVFPEVQKAAVYSRMLLADTELQSDAKELLRLAMVLDDRADEIIEDLREVYKSVFGFGYD